jgi:hypothetical protein
VFIAVIDHFAASEKPCVYKVLFVDEGANLLKAGQRRLRKLFDVDIAQGGEAGLSDYLSRLWMPPGSLPN